MASALERLLQNNKLLKAQQAKQGEEARIRISTLKLKYGENLFEAPSQDPIPQDIGAYYQMDARAAGKLNAMGNKKKEERLYHNAFRDDYMVEA